MLTGISHSHLSTQWIVRNQISSALELPMGASVPTKGHVACNGPSSPLKWADRLIDHKGSGSYGFD